MPLVQAKLGREVVPVRDAGQRSDWSLMATLAHDRYRAVEASSNCTGMTRAAGSSWSSKTAMPHVIEMPLVAVSPHAHPRRAIVSSPSGAWCRLSMWATAAMPMDTS